MCVCVHDIHYGAFQRIICAGTMQQISSSNRNDFPVSSVGTAQVNECGIHSIYCYVVYHMTIILSIIYFYFVYFKTAVLLLSLKEAQLAGFNCSYRSSNISLVLAK